MCYCYLSMTLCWSSTRCWVWYEVVRCCGLSKGCFWKDTRCTDGIVDSLERYLLVQSGIVDGLERCMRYCVGWNGISIAKSNSQIY
jgi:hypothetical protein